MLPRICAVVLAVSVWAGVRGTAEAAPLAPAKASDLASSVVLYSATPACTGMANAMELSGTPTPPPGKVFILTSYQWSVSTGGYPATFPISVGLAGVDDSSGINTGNIIAYSSAPNSGAGVVTQDAAIPNGVVAIRPSVGKTHLCIFPATSGTTLTGLGWVQGFFARDR